MRMSRRLVTLASVASIALLAITACSDKSTPTDSGSAGLGTLTIGSMLAYPPFNETDNGQPAGFEVDMLNDLSTRLGYSDISWVVSDFTGIIPNVAAHKVDMAATGVTGWAEPGTPTYDVVQTRIEQVSFSSPYFVTSAVLISKRADLTSVDQLTSGMTVAVEQGSQYFTWATNNLAPKGVQIVAAPQASLYTQLDGNHVDAVIDGTAPSAEAFKANPTLIIGQPVAGTQGGFCFVFAKDNTDLLTTFNDALAAYIADGSYATLYQKYFPGTQVPTLPTNNFA